MAGGDPEYDKGVVSLEDNDKDTEQGGGKAAGVRIFSSNPSSSSYLSLV